MKTKAKKTKLPQVILLGLIGAVVVGMNCLYGAPPETQEEMSADVCAECHDVIAHAMKTQPHAGNDCIAWHGDAEAHLGEGGGANIFAFGEKESS